MYCKRRKLQAAVPMKWWLRQQTGLPRRARSNCEPERAEKGAGKSKAFMKESEQALQQNMAKGDRDCHSPWHARGANENGGCDSKRACQGGRGATVSQCELKTERETA